MKQCKKTLYAFYDTDTNIYKLHVHCIFDIEFDFYADVHVILNFLHPYRSSQLSEDHANEIKPYIHPE